MHIVPIIAFAALLALQGCASALKQPLSRSANFKCVDTASSAAALGRANARAYARASLAHEIPEAKGYLISSGVRRVRIVSRRVECRPSVIAPSLSKCTAHARLCGR